MSPRYPGQEDGGGDPKEVDLSERMDRLNRSLEAKREAEENPSQRRSESDAKGFAQAMRLSTEFVAGILVGCAIGWSIDSGLGTSPWGLIVFLLLGFVAGVFNVLRAAGKMADPMDRKRGG